MCCFRGEKNVVYSRFGKEQFGSHCKYDFDRMRTSVPTVNLRVLKRQVERLESESGLINYEKCLKPTPKEYYTPQGEGDRTLMFESRFESGNLNLAVKLSDKEYNLVL